MILFLFSAALTDNTVWITAKRLSFITQGWEPALGNPNIPNTQYPEGVRQCLWRWLLIQSTGLLEQSLLRLSGL